MQKCKQLQSDCISILKSALTVFEILTAVICQTVLAYFLCSLFSFFQKKKNPPISHALKFDFIQLQPFVYLRVDCCIEGLELSYL